MSDLPIVLIEWIDSAQAAPGWQWLNELETPPLIRCTSVGFLVRDNDEEKCVAVSMGGNGDSRQVSGVISIPARSVLRMVRLTSSCPYPAAA